ncbi:UDP-N-acetylglucosamine 2-epimerase [subsurface metagenome]
MKIAGVDKDIICALTQKLLDNQAEYDKMARAVNPYGDGKVSARIVDTLSTCF